MSVVLKPSYCDLGTSGVQCSCGAGVSCYSIAASGEAAECTHVQCQCLGGCAAAVEKSMLDFWEHAIGYRRLDPAASGEPFRCTLEEAQAWCNFVVVQPGWIPPDCRLSEVTVRPETLQQPSSLRLTIQGEGRAFRVKQFHLDWWVPTSSDANLTAPGKPFQAAQIVGYQGRDYRGRAALCVHRYGSLLELGVLEGQFQDQELHLFLDQLEAVIPEAVTEVAALPFAQVSYHARRGPGLGPWNYDLLSGCRWSAARNAWRAEFAADRAYYPRWLPPSFLYDSVGTRHEPASHHWEYQLLFRHAGNLTDNLWIRAVGDETEKLLWIAPGLDRRMGIQLKSIALQNRRVRLGSTSEPHGERFAQWIENGVAFEVHARASLHVSQTDFCRFLDSIAPAAV